MPRPSLTLYNLNPTTPPVDPEAAKAAIAEREKIPIADIFIVDSGEVARGFIAGELLNRPPYALLIGVDRDTPVQRFEAAVGRKNCALISINEGRVYRYRSAIAA